MSNFNDLAQELIGGINIENVVVRAEDIQQEGIDYAKHYFEPEVGSTYLIKFLPFLGTNGKMIFLRNVYKNLPDPTRKGQKFRYTCSAESNSNNKPLELFFNLHKAAKDGDGVAKLKIEKYLKRSNQSCALIQILQSPKQEEIGKIRLFVFSNFGPNALIASLVNGKLNPTKKQLEQGFEKENIFDIFESPVLSLTCEESVYEDQKGRDYTGSQFSPKLNSAIYIGEDGTQHKFSPKDKDENGKVKPEVTEYITKFCEQLTNPDFCPYNYFLPIREFWDKLTEDTKKYIETVEAKVDEILPVIENSSILEIENYGKSVSTTKKTNIMGESVPEDNMVEGAEELEQVKQTKPTKSNDKPTKSNDKPTISKESSIEEEDISYLDEE